MSRHSRVLEPRTISQYESLRSAWAEYRQSGDDVGDLPDGARAESTAGRHHACYVNLLDPAHLPEPQRPRLAAYMAGLLHPHTKEKVKQALLRAPKLRIRP